MTTFLCHVTGNALHTPLLTLEFAMIIHNICKAPLCVFTIYLSLFHPCGAFGQSLEHSGDVNGISNIKYSLEPPKNENFNTEHFTQNVQDSQNPDQEKLYNTNENEKRYLAMRKK